MARIAGVELQDKWKVTYALTQIKGIGWSLAEKVLVSCAIDPSKKIADLSRVEVSKIVSKIEEYPIEGELARQTRTNISRLKAMGSYRGLRHTGGLPVRGQRTRSNARTKRGKRKTVGAFKKEDLAKVQQQKEQKAE